MKSLFRNRVGLRDADTLRRAHHRATAGTRPRASPRPRRAARARPAPRRARPPSIGARRARLIFGCCVSATTSSSPHSSSCSFSPARTPMNSIGMSRSGSLPERRIMFCARSRIFTGSPMSRTKISPRPPIEPAWMTSDTASGRRHEVARHLRVRDRHRPALGDLALEDPDHRAGRVEHVAEAHGDEPRRDVVAARRRPRRSTRTTPSTARTRPARSAPCPSRRARSAARRTRRRPRRRPSSRARCSAPTRAGSPPSSARACRRRRGRRRSAGSARRPGAAARGSRRRRSPARRPGSCGRRRARARSRTAAISAWSTRMSREAPARATWRQSSEPIEPPAPVTSTVSPRRYSEIASKSTSTGSRPRMSSTWTGRICAARLASPEISS